MKKQKKSFSKNIITSKLELQAISNLEKISEDDESYFENWNEYKRHEPSIDDAEIKNKRYFKKKQQRKSLKKIIQEDNVQSLEKELVSLKLKEKRIGSVPKLEPVQMYQKIEEEKQMVSDEEEENQKKIEEEKKKENNYALDKEKLRKMSLPWIKEIPYKKLSIKELNEKKHYHKNLEVIKRKKSHRYLKNFKSNHKEDINEEIEEKQGKNKLMMTIIHAEKKEQRDLRASYCQEMELLKKWLDMNKKKNRKSITSLLREHFENRYQEKKEQRAVARSINEKYRTLLG